MTSKYYQPPIPSSFELYTGWPGTGPDWPILRRMFIDKDDLEKTQRTFLDPRRRIEVDIEAAVDFNWSVVNRFVLYEEHRVS